ncbi:MAG: hypothetical protein F6K41_33915 [Symploca sp. SIO3E6]|nr:hypothetical protein [Caldora sp. SIO3E6]
MIELSENLIEILDLRFEIDSVPPELLLAKPASYMSTPELLYSNKRDTIK